MSPTAACFRSVRQARFCTLLVTCWALMSLPLQAAPPATPVFVQQVKQTPFVQTLEALGTLRANESVTLSAKVTETISAVHFTDNQRVSAGDVLVEMTNAAEQAALAEAQSELDETQRQYERVRSLVESDLATQSTLDERQRAYRSAQARLEGVRSRLQDLLIIAPFDGVVGLRNVSVGALVRPGDTITTLDDDSVMKLDMTVPSTYLDVVRPGLTVNARARALENREFTGKVASVDSRVDPITRSVVVRALIANDDRSLKPGLLMTVELQKPARDAIMLREEAVVQRGPVSQVFVVEEPGSESGAQAVAREVQLGVRTPGWVEITSGLTPGDRVVIHGTHKLRDGSAVRVTATAEGDETLQELLQQSRGASNGTSTTAN